MDLRCCARAPACSVELGYALTAVLITLRLEGTIRTWTKYVYRWVEGFPTFETAVCVLDAMFVLRFASLIADTRERMHLTGCRLSRTQHRFLSLKTYSWALSHFNHLRDELTILPTTPRSDRVDNNLNTVQTCQHTVRTW